MTITADANHAIGCALEGEFCLTIRDPEDGTIQGAVSFVPYPRKVRIENIGSHVPGTGRRLMLLVEAVATGRPIVLGASRSAIGFYKKLGFRITRNASRSVVNMRKDTK